jgi:hypothetical protein
MHFLNTAIKYSALLPLFPLPKLPTKQTLVMPMCGPLFSTVYAVAGKIAKQAAKSNSLG